jgi:hypothetical protein
MRQWRGDWVKDPDGSGWLITHSPKTGKPILATCDKWFKLPSGERTPCPRQAVWQREEVNEVAGLAFRSYSNRCDWHPPAEVHVNA